MKRLFILLIASCSLLTMSVVEGGMRLPNEFSVKQRWCSWTIGFDIMTAEEKLGSVYRSCFSLRPQYDFYDSRDQWDATASMHWFSWGPIFDMVDNRGVFLGRVEERIFSCYPTFDLYNHAGLLVATAKRNFWGTKYTIRDPQSCDVIATLSRAFFRLKDNWTVSILCPEFFDNERIDARLFITVMAFQTDSEHWNRPSETVDYSGVEEQDLQHIVTFVETQFAEDQENEDNSQEDRIEILRAISQDTSVSLGKRLAATYLLKERCAELVLDTKIYKQKNI